MGLNRAMDISVSGIEAQRITMELIASNLANINTTRTVYGGPYRRRVPVLSEKSLSFAEELSRAERKLHGGGVEVTEVVEDSSPFQKVYKPGHPDADEQGFVSLPNVDMSTEMVDLMYSSRLYEANITAFNATKKMMQDTLQLP
ncbi:flagellar biosynthesis protein FlgC [candidate division WOR-1 bacterium DG_54_3]|uniref:Flagellar basal-body rod protein FlgC n=1 Tax=candidate division WOR-1 bacterium DG_54_3 TaxID=1703775 RepID=A0A0S7Y5W9_UNCSA|nr:MAG: flagellar biosynthesis protein FlgC [candidate division WOR-1 bacterium DG_54_3]